MHSGWKALGGALGTLAMAPAMADGPPIPAAGDIAVEACVAAVLAAVGDSQLVVLNKDYSEANSAVLIGVGADRAPWRCLVSNDGVVAELRAASEAVGLPVN